MLDHPDRADLLEAVAGLLEGELRGALSDPRLSFRALIAAHLCRTIALECRHGETAELAELDRLRGLVQAKAAKDRPATTAQRRSSIAELNQSLAAKIKAQGGQPEVLAHLRETLRADLAIASPRFELGDRID
jgi:hypothetical protein